MAVDISNRVNFFVLFYKKKVRISSVCLRCQLYLPGALACSCNPVTWRQVLLDGLLWGFPITISTCRSGVRTKACINMQLSGELERSRLTKEWRKGPGGKPSSQKLPCVSVVGPRQRVADGYLPYCKPDSELFILLQIFWSMVAKLKLQKGRKGTTWSEPAGQFLNYYELIILLPGEVWLQSGNSKNGREGTTRSGARGSIDSSAILSWWNCSRKSLQKLPKTTVFQVEMAGYWV